MTSGADAWLVDDRWGKAYPISEDTTIGRGSASNIILRDPAVSRHHATVRRRGLQYVLEVVTDAGTNLNGNAVTGETVLQEGDLIDIALTCLRFTQRAPTGEMFIVSRDYPALGREGPTRPTLHAMHPITLYSRARSYWHIALALMLTIALVTLCADFAR